MPTFVVDSTFQGPVYCRAPLTTIVDKGLLHFDWILVEQTVQYQDNSQIPLRGQEENLCRALD